MIVLKKGNHYEHTTVPEKASKMVQDGYEVVKGKSLLASVKKQPKSEPKKKVASKKKK